MFERRAIEKRFGRAGLAAFLGAVTTEGAARPRLVEVAALAWVEAERRRQTLRFALRGEVAVPFTCVDGLADVLHESASRERQRPIDVDA